MSRDLVAAIPRLETVAAAIGWQRARFDGQWSAPDVPVGPDLPLAARILRVASDFDAGMAQRPSVQGTLAAMQADAGAHDPEVLGALIRCHDASTEPEAAPRDVDVDDLRPEMVIFDDIHTTDGVLLVGRGTVVTEALITRLENYIEQGRVTDAIRVTG